MSKRDLKTHFLLWLIVAGALLYFFAHKLDWQAVRESFRNVRPAYALAAVLPILLTYVLRALRWRAFLAPVARASFRNLFSSTVIGFSSIFVFGRVGEVARPVMLSLREGIKPTATFATILIERLFDWVAVVLMFAVNLLILDRLTFAADKSHQLDVIRNAGVGMLLLAAVGVFGLFMFRLRARGAIDWVDRHTPWLPSRPRTVMLNLLDHLAEGLYVLHDARNLFVTAGFTFAIWSLVILSFWLTMTAFDLGYGVSQVIFVLGCALVGSVVPTPGGSAGAFHAATMIGMVLLGTESNRAASTAIAVHFVAFGSALIFGIYFFVRDGISFRELRRMISEEVSETHGVSPRAVLLEETEPVGARQ